MQYNSCHSGHHCTGNQSIASSGSLWPHFDNSVSCRGSRDNNFLFQPPNIDQGLNYHPDLLREIMLKHEATFKCQIYELHRLYGRQRQLMDEIQMRKLSTNCFVSRMQCDISQKPVQQIPSWLLSNPTDNKPQGLENFQKLSTFVPGKSIHVSSGHYTVENDVRQLEASSSRRKKFRKRLLDLELPAELYMDVDDREQLEEEKITEMHPVLPTPKMNISNSSKKINVGIPSEGTSINSNSNYQRMSCVFDLNEPVQGDEQKMFTSPTCCNLSSREMHQDQDLSGSPRSKSSVSNEFVHGIPDEKGRSFTSSHQISFSGKLPLSCKDKAGSGLEFAGNEKRFMTSSMTTSSSLLPFSSDTNTIGSINKPRDVPVVVQSLPCFNTPPLNGTSGASTGSAGIKQENLCSNLNDSGYPRPGSSSFDTENQSPDERYCVARCSFDSNRTETVVDLNLNVMPSIFFPETEACQEKFKFTDGVVNLDLNVMPSSSMSETEISEGKVGVDCRNDLDKSDYEGKIGLNTTLLDPNSSSSQFSGLTSISSASSSSENEHIQKHEESEIPARVMPCNSSPELETCSKDETYASTENVKEISMSETFIGRPSSFREENLSQPTVPDGVGTATEEPYTQDKKESFPTREGSEENQTKQVEDSYKDIDSIAAETILSISLSGGQQCLKTSINCPVDASIKCLNWFAGIVSSAAGYVEDEFNVMREHFEAKTFKFTGIKVEDTFCETTDQRNIIPGDPALPSQRRRGRRARNAGKQKEIHKEVATKTVRGRKNGSKIGHARGKRLSSKSLPNMAGRRPYSLSKQQQQQQQQQLTHESEQGLLFGWGKKNRRQKHKRAQN